MALCGSARGEDEQVTETRIGEENVVEEEKKQGGEVAKDQDQELGARDASKKWRSYAEAAAGFHQNRVMR